MQTTDNPSRFGGALIPMADTNDTPNVVNAVPADSGVPLQPMQTGYVPEDVEYAHLNQPDTLDVAAATWRSSTLVGQIINNFQDVDAGAHADPTFNAYGYIDANKDKYQDLLPLVSQGSLTFDGIDSQAGFDAWVAAQRRNLKDRQTLASADTWKSLVTMPIAMLDATLLLGPVAGGVSGVTLARLGSGLAGRAAAGALAGGLDIAAQQAGVSMLNDAQTAEEAFMNIGVGMTLGAGMGAVFRHAKPDNVLLAGNPGNPMHTENLEAVHAVNEHHIGQTPDEGTVFGLDSIGAARATVDDDSLIATSPSPIARAVEWATTFGHYTPLQRLGEYSVPLVRETMLGLMDTGGLLTRAMARGEARPVEAETLKTIYEQRMQNARERVASIYRAANADLGQSGARTSAGEVFNTLTQGARDVNMIPQEAFNEAVSLIQRGSNAQASNEQISQAVMDRMTQAGLSLDQAKAVHARVYEAEKAYHEAYDALKDEAVQQGLMDPEKLVEGRYGMPQIWDRNGVDANPEGLKAFLQEHLGGKPTDDWLRENRFIADATEATSTGEQTPPASWDELKRTTDATALNSILRQWRGEENEFSNQYLLSKLADYQQRQLKAQDHAATVLGTLKGSERDWHDAKLSEMRTAARAVERNAILRKVASAQLKASRAAESVQGALRRLGGDEGLVLDLSRQLERGGMSLDQAAGRVEAARSRAVAAAQNEALQLQDALRGKVQGLKEQNGTLLTEKRGVLGDLKDIEENLGGTELARAQNPLRQQRDVLNMQSRANRAEILKIREQLRDALAEQRAAQAELRTANADFDTLARTQRDVRAWHDAAAKEVSTIVQHEGEALLEPSLRLEMDNHLAAASELRDVLDRARESRRSAFDVMRQAGQEARAAVKASDRSASQLRKVAFQARKGMSDTSPLTKYVDGLVNDLRGTERAPRGLLLDKSPTSGRLKERQFQFDFGEYNRLVESGFLRGNADDAFQGYFRDLGGQLAAHRGLGGRPIDDILREVQDSYDAAIGSELDPKRADALRAEASAAKADLTHAHDRIIGRYDVKDHNGITWTADRIRQLGVIRYIGGFVFSAIGDIATSAFAAPGSVLRAVALKGARDYQYILRQAAVGDKDAEELKMILGSLETGIHLNQSDRALGRGESADLLGFGSGTARKASRAIEQAMNTTADYANKLSGLKAFSDNMRRTAGLVQLANIRKWVADYDLIGKGKQVQLAALGIGEPEARRLNALFQQYGTEQRQGLFSPGVSKWLSEPDGEEMKYVLESALVKTQKRASYTSGFGNQPLVLDKWYGKLFLQFQTMALQFSNNFIRAGMQYGFATGDHIRFAHSLGTALAAGVLMNAIATFRKGEDIQDQAPQQFAYNVVQRSGLLGIAGAYADSAVKLMDPVLNQHLGWTLGGGASKFSQNSWLANLMGPWGGNIETLQQLGANAVNGDLDKAGRKALLLAPLNQQAQIIARMLSVNP